MKILLFVAAAFASCKHNRADMIKAKQLSMDMGRYFYMLSYDLEAKSVDPTFLDRVFQGMETNYLQLKAQLQKLRPTATQAPHITVLEITSSKPIFTDPPIVLTIVEEPTETVLQTASGTVVANPEPTLQYLPPPITNIPKPRPWQPFFTTSRPVTTLTA